MLFTRVKIKKGRRLEMLDAKKWIDRWDRWTTAITFAEAGQREMALEALNEKPREKRRARRVRKRAEQRPVLRVQ
jgi:hypothetical protein